MTFNQINYFLAVAQHLNFTRAATALFVTQSTLSRSIAALETELGVKLLERDFHNVRLTPAGELMNREMQGIMGAINGLIHRVQQVDGQENERLVIGILEGQAVASSMLFAIRILSDNFPQFSVDIRKMSHQELIEAAKAGDIHVAETILAPDTVLDEELKYLRLEDVKNYLVAWTEDPIWKRKPCLESLRDCTLVVPEKNHPGMECVIRGLADAGVEPAIRKASDMETHSLWLDAGVGVSICNEGHVICASPSVRPLMAVPMDELPMVSIALMWSEKRTTPMLERFLDYVDSSVERAVNAERPVEKISPIVLKEWK